MNVNTNTNNDEDGKTPNHQDFKLCASGAGVIVYQLFDDKIRVLLALRAKEVGQGYGITGGGFVECKNIDNAPINTLFQTSDEAFREMMEENTGFEKIIDADDFIERAQPISLVHARINDINRVHSVSMFALRVTDNEWKKISVLAPSKEREGSLREYFVTWDSKIDRRVPERSVRIINAHGEPITQSGFWHKHEMHTIACIAWHAQNDRLWK
jgi:hypothetical protein